MKAVPPAVPTCMRTIVAEDQSVNYSQRVGLDRGCVSLAVQTALVTAGALTLVKLSMQLNIQPLNWLIAPAIFVVSALIHTFATRGTLSELGCTFRGTKYSLRVLALTVAVAFGSVFVCFWLCNAYGFKLPFLPSPPRQDLAAWTAYQLLYVAAAEELFFRGYLQTNCLRIAAMQREPVWVQNWISIGISAGAFAVAHVIIIGSTVTVLTFLPGVIAGWLFMKTRSLLAPILFHGLANVFYALVLSPLL